MTFDEQPDDPHGQCRLEIERLQDDLEVALVRVEALDTTVVHMQARLDAVCEEHGHLPRVRGDWPEDNVCPRCGDLKTGLIEHAPEPGRCPVTLQQCSLSACRDGCDRVRPDAAAVTLRDLEGEEPAR